MAPTAPLCFMIHARNANEENVASDLCGSPTAACEVPSIRQAYLTQLTVKDVTRV